jgi:hypothetical protein
MVRFGLALLLTVTVALPGTAMTVTQYQANLGPMPLDDETKAVIAGRGEATATLSGRTLTIEGRFGGLPSNATKALLALSPAIGVPGKPAHEFALPAATEGVLSTSIRLSSAEAEALRTGRLYLQIDSEKAPPGYSWGPQGTLWGWLLPAHETAGQDMPQQGHWFIPQLDTPAR